MDPRQSLVTTEQDQTTLASVVRELMEGLSWSKSRELVRTGRVSVDGELRFDPAERMRAGANIEINPSGRKRRSPVLERERLVHIDRDLVVVRKPAGLLSVPYDDKDSRDTLIERTRQALREYGPRDEASRSDRLFIVQRLDKDTTGLLVFARTRAGRKGLEAQFRDHSITRRYVAIVHGRAVAAVHDSRLVANRGDGRRGSWRGPNVPQEAKRAITKVRIEQNLRGGASEATLVSCQLETGRQHQIRIHLAEDGTPLVGEQIYDPRPQQRKLQADRPMLHAASLGFRHPVNHRPLRFEAAPPDDFQAMLDALAG